MYAIFYYVEGLYKSTYSVSINGKEFGLYCNKEKTLITPVKYKDIRSYYGFIVLTKFNGDIDVYTTCTQKLYENYKYIYKLLGCDVMTLVSNGCKPDIVFDAYTEQEKFVGKFMYTEAMHDRLECLYFEINNKIHIICGNKESKKIMDKTNNLEYKVINIKEKDNGPEKE